MYFFPGVRIGLVCLLPFRQKTKWYGMGLVFYRWMSWFQLFLTSVFLIDRFVLKNFSAFFFRLSFSDCSVVVVVLWFFCLIQSIFFNQSIPSSGLMSFCSVLCVVNFFLNYLLSASTVTFPANLNLFFQRPDFFYWSVKFSCLLLFYRHIQHMETKSSSQKHCFWHSFTWCLPNAFTLKLDWFTFLIEKTNCFH